MKPKPKGKVRPPVYSISARNDTCLGPQGVTRKGSSTQIDETITVDSGDESDGLSALRNVEASDAKTQPARRGPSNISMQHFHDPIPVLDSRTGARRWEFTCRFCDK
jgi:hypothetical protein